MIRVWVADDRHLILDLELAEFHRLRNAAADNNILFEVYGPESGIARLLHPDGFTYVEPYDPEAEEATEREAEQERAAAVGELHPRGVREVLT